MADEEADIKEDELPEFGTSGFDIGFMELQFFDASLRRSYLEDAPTLIGSVVSSGASFPGTPSNGQTFFRTDTGKLYIYDGTDWRQIIVALATGVTPFPGRRVQE
ncbi:hypothetical protein LCGC14_2983450 [marine sediment metagenome]|uniref:Uncharacterized protein n=1 Tax=marine sediment metagenome TaxID=412755 RepID=A0A0F8XTG4_9ZZZZ